MITLPAKIYLSRKDVLAAVGGRVQLERLERAGALKRRFLPGYVHARYLRADVKRVLDDLGAGSS